MILRCWLTCSVFVMALGAVASAQPADGDPADGDPADGTPAAEKPWAVGVPPAKREQALREFERGNSFFERSQYADALRAYNAAVKSWDHPAIRYNMAVSQIHLDKPIEAFANLKQALRFDRGPLSAELFRQAQTYDKLLRGQLSTLTVKCQQKGAAVTVDGNEFVSCPGAVTRILLPGPHQIVGQLDGHVTKSVRLTLVGGSPAETNIELTKVGETRFETRFPRWIPWTTLAAGVVIAAVGVPLLRSADSKREDFAAAVAANPDCLTGCARSQLSQETRDLESSADLRDTLSVTAFAVGGAIAATGIVLLVLNRPQPVEEAPIEVTPVVGVGQFGAAIVGRF